MKRIFLIALALVTAVASAYAVSVTLSWTHSPSPEVTGYNVLTGPRSQTYTNIQTVGYINTATVSNLSSGTTYFFNVVAFDSLGDVSPLTTEVVFTTPSSNGIPSVVKDFAVVTLK